MATRYLSRALLSTTKPLTSVLFNPYTTAAVGSSSAFIPRPSFMFRLRPLVAAASTTFFRSLAPVISTRGFATRQTSSSLNDPNPNWSNRPPKETILLDGCDFEHWLVVVEPPEGDLTRDEIIDSYIKTLAMVVGSEEEARMKIYSVSTRHYFAFGALVSEELSLKLKDIPKVRLVLPDSYLDVRNKDYGGEPFINGQAVPYDPKYHEEWVRNNSRANERNRLNDRPRNHDRSRKFERRRDMQMNNQGPGGVNMGPPHNVSGPPPQNAPNYGGGGMPPQNNPGNYPPRGPPPPANNAPNFLYGPNSGPAPYQSGPGPNSGPAPYQSGLSNCFDIDMDGADANANPISETDLELNYNSEASTGDKRKQEGKLRSKVWQHFTKIIKEDGKCDKCQCNHCQKLFTCSSRSGTTHLLRHITDGICPVFQKDKAVLTSCYSPRSNVLLPLKFDHHPGPGQSSTQPRCTDVDDPFGSRPFKTIINEEEYGGQTPLLTSRGKLPLNPQPKGEAWMGEFRNCVAKLVELTNGKIPVGPGTGPIDYSISAALKCLNEMEDIPQSGEMYLDAFEILQDGGERECFICLPAEPRRRWLQRVLHRRHPMRYSSNM